MVNMIELPVELQVHILMIALEYHAVPSCILRVNRSWRDVLEPLLHSNIRLESLTQLYLFSTSASLCKPPKSFSLRLPGGFGLVHFTGSDRDEGTLVGKRDPMPKPDDIRGIKMKIVDNGGVWGCLKAALQRCRTVESVTLRLHSFVSDPNLTRITSSLSVIKFLSSLLLQTHHSPRSFQWTGPDPDTHLSTAIVAPATEHLFRAIKAWSNLEKLTLTHVKFPTPPASSIISSVFAFQTHSVLQEIHIGQSVALKPEDVAAIVISVPSLLTLTLEDAYISSIWGPRISLEDVTVLVSHLSEYDVRKQRLNEVIKCTARLERAIGGDRG